MICMRYVNNLKKQNKPTVEATSEFTKLDDPGRLPIDPVVSVFPMAYRFADSIETPRREDCVGWSISTDTTDELATDSRSSESTITTDRGRVSISWIITFPFLLDGAAAFSCAEYLSDS